MGNPDAAFFMDEFFEFGTETMKPDLQAAASWYSTPLLRFDDEALTRLGVVEEKLGAYASAFDNYAKAMSLGSLQGLLHFSDCYMNAYAVERDRPFACKILLEAFSETYARFTMGDTKEAGPFSSLCYLFAPADEIGYVVENDNMVAHRR